MQWCIIYLNFFSYMEKILYSSHSCQRHLKRVSNKYLRSSNSQDHEVIKHYMQLMNIHKYILILESKGNINIHGLWPTYIRGPTLTWMLTKIAKRPTHRNKTA